MTQAPSPPPATRRTILTGHNEELPPGGPSFDARFFDRADGFAKEQLLLIPELESVLVVPTWYTEQHALPFGLIKSRNPQQRQVAEIFRMCQQINGIYAGQVQLLMQALNGADQYAKQLADTIATKQTELATLQGQIEIAKRQLGNPSPAENMNGPETPSGDTAS